MNDLMWLRDCEMAMALALDLAHRGFVLRTDYDNAAKHVARELATVLARVREETARETWGLAAEMADSATLHRFAQLLRERAG